MIWRRKELLVMQRGESPDQEKSDRDRETERQEKHFPKTTDGENKRRIITSIYRQWSIKSEVLEVHAIARMEPD